MILVCKRAYFDVLIALLLALSSCDLDDDAPDDLGGDVNIDRPILLSISPAQGRAGERVSIFGSNLQEVDSLFFGSLGVSPDTTTITTIEAIVPNIDPSVITIEAITNSDTSNALQWEIVPSPPLIESFTPDTAVVGDTVTLFGENLLTTNRVSISGDVNNLTSILNDEKTEGSIRFIVPSGASTSTILVETDGGSAVSVTRLILLPVINDISPERILRGQEVAIIGESLNGDSSKVFIDDVEIGELSTVSSTLISFIYNDDSFGTGRIRIENEFGNDTSLNELVIIEQPIVNSFDPPSGSASDKVTIFGDHFDNLLRVLLGSVECSIQSSNANSIVVTIPEGAETNAFTIETMPCEDINNAELCTINSEDSFIVD